MVIKTVLSFSETLFSFKQLVYFNRYFSKKAETMKQTMTRQKPKDDLCQSASLEAWCAQAGAQSDLLEGRTLRSLSENEHFYNKTSLSDPDLSSGTILFGIKMFLPKTYVISSNSIPLCPCLSLSFFLSLSLSPSLSFSLSIYLILQYFALAFTF